MRTIVLDNEAVQSLVSVTHRKHRTVLAHLEGVASRRRRSVGVEVVVPTAVRVEAGWDRSRPGAAVANRFPLADRTLDASTANVAAAIVAAGIVGSVADAHVGAIVQRLASAEIVVITSDPRDVAAVCSPVAVTIVTI